MSCWRGTTDCTSLSLLSSTSDSRCFIACTVGYPSELNRNKCDTMATERIDIESCQIQGQCDKNSLFPDVCAEFLIYSFGLHGLTLSLCLSCHKDDYDDIRCSIKMIRCLIAQSVNVPEQLPVLLYECPP